MAPNSAEDEEEEETCGFCIFMKAGGCKETFNVSARSSVFAVLESPILIISRAALKVLPIGFNQDFCVIDCYVKLAVHHSVPGVFIQQ